jgi:hypothetical protein
MSRETVYLALYNLGAAASGFLTKGRKLKHIEEIDASQFPCFFQVQVEETWQHGNGGMGNLPPIGQFAVEWWVYVREPDPNVPATIKLNAALDTLTAALGLPPAAPGPKQTLSNQVESVQLAGKIDIVEGVLEDRAYARIPLIIKLTK